jgi:Aspartyl protease
MPSHEYSYGHWTDAPTTDVIYRPFIPIVPRANGEELLPINGLIDTGANRSFIDLELAEVLGFDFKGLPSKPVGGLGGSGGKGWSATISVYVPDFDFEYTSHVIFTKLDEQIMILGQRDFLKEFDVLFQAKKNKFTVYKTPEITF